MTKQKYFKLLSILLLMCCTPIASISAATPVDGDTFLFIGSGNTADYASDFASLVNSDSSLGITITAQGYSSGDLITDYYDGRYTDRAAIVTAPTLVNNALTSKLDEDFDYIVFLGDADDLNDYPEQFLEEAHLVKDWLRWQNKSSKMVIAGVWDTSTGATRLAMHEKLYRIGDALETEVAPANKAWEALINDSSVGVSNSALSSHSGEARYSLAASIFTHYFEHPTGNSAFTLSGLSAAEKTAIDLHAYNNWVIAQNTAQYIGEFTGSHCRPGQLTIGSGTNTINSLAFGSSTEAAITNTMASAYSDASNFQISRYWYDPNSSGNTYNSGSKDDIRYPYILYPNEYVVTASGKEKGPFYLAAKDYDFGLDRWNGSGSQTATIHHQDFKALSKNPDIQFVGYWRHSGQETSTASYALLNYDLTRISYGGRVSHSYTNTVRASMGDPDYAHTLPVAVGFGRFIEARHKNAPYANDAPVYWGVHMGRYYESWMASMLYVLATGEKPAYKVMGWSRTAGGVTINADDWNFAIDQAYEVMVNHGSLKGANGEVMPLRTNYAPLALNQGLNLDQDTVSDITIPLIATDKESTPLSFSIVSAPAHGSVSMNGSIVTYTPDSAYNSGSDDFTFKVNDGSFDSNIATVSIAVGNYSPVPEINVLGNGLGISDGSVSSAVTNHTAFPELIVQQAVGSTRTFTILNSGLADLDLSGVVTVTGADAADFTITQQAAVDPLASNLSTNFEVTFLASSVGTKHAVVHIPSNDSDEADFDFAVSGIANAVELEYVNTSFAEAAADDGSIDSTPIIINIQHETFSGLNGRDLVADGDVIVYNLPAELTATVIKVSDTQLSATLSGAVTYHEASQSVESLTFSFPDSAFATYPSAGIVNSSRSDLQIILTGDIPYVGNGNDSGTGSLRRVVADASDGSTVRFLPFVTAVNLTTTPVIIDRDLVIDGGGAVTIDGGSVTSHFHMLEAGITVTLQDLALTNGRNTINGVGGSIYSLVDLTLTDCILSNNTSDYDGSNRGGAVYSRGNLTVNNSVFINNECTQTPGTLIKRNSFGGAIDQEGYTLTINDSEFENNKAIATSYEFSTTGLGRGGALYLSNVVGSVITNAQFKNNVATSIGSTKTGDTSGGAIYSECKTGDGDLTIDQSLFVGNSAATAGNSYGGALSFVADERNSTVTITNTTIYNNDTGASRSNKKSEGGAIFVKLIDLDPLAPTATVNIYNSTIAGSTTVAATTVNALGGGLALDSGSLTLESVIISDNSTLGDGQDIMLQSGGALMVSNSLIESTDGSHGLSNGVDGNIIGLDALLDVLADNGGSTQTIGLLAGSPAIDAGSNSLGLTTDQRGSGFDRLIDTQTDIGSYEYLFILAPGTLELSAATYSIAENANSIEITVNRNEASNGAISVDYATSDGSATAGSDYTATSGTLNWADGDMSSKSFTVYISSDVIVEGDEDLIITLSNINGSTISGPNPSILTITNSDIVEDIDYQVMNVFTSNMVLQREQAVPVWGTGNVGDLVTVTMSSGESADATTDSNGNWKVHLPILTVGGPYDMTISSVQGDISLTNILVGDVWLCSGQSNMHRGLNITENALIDAAAANYPNMRLMLTSTTSSTEPQTMVNLSNTWKECTTSTAKPFSGTGYFFGRKLHIETGVPIGLIGSALSGTKIEKWMPEDLGAELGYDETEQPTVLFNGMINPYVGMAMKGFIWYQGESNVSGYDTYRAKQISLMSSWRELWGYGDLPFYFVQLAPYIHDDDTILPEMWDVQRLLLSEPNTGVAILNDIGDLDDIHPGNKLDVGERLARWALKHDYAQTNLIHTGPLFQSAVKRNQSVRIIFAPDSVENDIISRDGLDLTWFELAGEDEVYVTAVATIDTTNNTVLVTAATIPNPKYVRFAWSGSAIHNLMNLVGLPASAFQAVVSNQSPALARPDSYLIFQDTTMGFDVLANDWDSEDDLLSVNVAVDVAHGVLTIVDNVFEYTPALNYTGSDSFTYYINDGTDDSNIVTVSILVQATRTTPEIDITGDGNEILDGSIKSSLLNFTSFPEVIIGATLNSTRTFTITNNGGSDLELNGVPLVAISGVDSAYFSVTQQPAITTLTVGQSTTFDITFTTSEIDRKTAVVYVLSNDSDEGSYNFSIEGSADYVGLNYVRSTFDENLTNTGAVDTDVIINLKGDIFTGVDGRDFVADGDVVVTNLPDGLTAVITKINNTQVIATLTGVAVDHENYYSIDDVTFQFQDRAFTINVISGIEDSSRSDISVKFIGGDFYVRNSNDSGEGSLRQIIADALDGSTVRFLPLITGVNLSTIPVTIDKDLVIIGAGAVTIDGGSMISHLRMVESDITVTLEDLTLTNGSNTTDGEGGSIYSQADLTLTNCVLSNNSSNFDGTNRGGAIYSRGNLTINNCIFNNNECSQTPATSIKRNSFGGAIDQEGYSLIINDSSFENNSAIATSYQFATTGLGYGGALYLSNVVGSVITNTQFKDNVATSIGSSKTGDTSGGAIYSECKTGDGDLTIDKSLFLGNSTATAGHSYGGALSFEANERNSTVTITNTTIYNNDTGASRSGKQSEGGAIFVKLIDLDPLAPTATVNIYNSTIAGNTTVAATTINALGGGLALNSGSLTLESVIISDNSAQGDGQDLMLQSAGALTVATSLIESSDGGHGLSNGVDGNIIGQDALLGSLADNGGPTQTIELLTGSPALDAGSNSLSLTTDQRGTGYSRSFGNGVDMGAFEAGPTVEVFADWVSNSGLNGANDSYDADPDGDGVVNLLEYLIDSDPLSSETMGLAPFLDGGNQLGITYQSDRAVEPADLGITVEGSNDLGIADTWITVPATHTVSGSGPYTHHWEQDSAIGAGGKAFIRLRIAQP